MRVPSSAQAAPRDPVLRGQKHCDVAIVGAGLTGVTLAWMLTRRGVSVSLLEAGEPGCGATAGCTGKVTAQLEEVYARVAQTRSLSEAQHFALLAREAMRHIVTLAKRASSPLDITAQQLRFAAFATDQLAPLHALYCLQRKMQLPVHWENDLGDCPVPCYGAVSLPHQAMLDPQAYLHMLLHEAMAQGCKIYLHSPVRALAPHFLRTPKGELHAQIIVLCTGMPLDIKRFPLLALTEQQTLARAELTGGPHFTCSYVECRANGLALRPTADGLIVTKALGRVGSTCLRPMAKTFQQEVRQAFPEAALRDVFFRQDVFSRDGLPLIGPVHPRDSHLLMATGYSGWGLVGSYLAARLLCENILGRSLPEGASFLPNRPQPKAHLTLLPGALRQASSWLGGLFRPTAPVCPHLGCRLRYFADGERWLCPCHGSAFTFMGDPLASPAQEPAHITLRHRRNV